MMSRLSALAVLAALAACGRSDTSSGPNGSGGDSPGATGDAGAGGSAENCMVAIPFQPSGELVADPTRTIQITASVKNATGVLAYHWTVLFRGVAVAAARVLGDGAAIEIPIPAAGVYTARVQVSGTTQSCPEASATINVRAPNANIRSFGLRLVPPPSSLRPVQVQVQSIYGGGASDLGILLLSAGSSFHATVTSDTGGVPAYLQFTSGGTLSAVTEAVNEAFVDHTGVVDGRLPLQSPHTVMIVPSTSEFVPRRIAGWVPGDPLEVDRGTPVTGTVRGPGGAVLAAATVAISASDLPSTVAVTAADGGFAMRAESVAGAALASVEVAPPSGSGLPRLVAAVAPSAELAIGYAPGLALIDLAGAVVQRSGAPLPGARVTVVGSLAAAGTITGAASVTATGAVRVTAIADGAGVLPRLRVPAAALTAVIEAAPGDLAIVSLDTRGGAPAVIEATAPRHVTTAILDSGGGALPGAVVDLVPGGALADAGIPARRVTAGADGAIDVALPATGRYELRFQDPLARSAPLMVAEGAVADIAASYRLPPTILVSGSVLDGLSPIAGVAIQVLCVESCSARDRARPMLEAVSDTTGRFTLALPDPGTRPGTR